MNIDTPNLSRRSFIIGSAAVGSGLALGLNIPFGPGVVRAADGSPEITAWVVIRPDDTVVVRIARSEMGQGTLTGLAQMVAEELECDWSKVTTEYPTPGQSVARKRVWGDFSTGGSRGIRTSQEYVRKGGAIEDTVGRKCLCNALAANIGLGQTRFDGYAEMPMVTLGAELGGVKRMYASHPAGWGATEAIGWLLSEVGDRRTA